MEKADVDAMVAATREAAPAAAPAAAASAATPDDGTAAPISIDEFARVDLRVARVVAADAVEGADKLLS